MNRTGYYCRDPVVDYRKQQEARDVWNLASEEHDEALRLMKASTKHAKTYIQMYALRKKRMKKRMKGYHIQPWDLRLRSKY